MSERELRMPPRPTLPPSLWALMLCFAVIAICMRVGMRCGEARLLPAGIVLTIGAGATGIVAAMRMRRTVAVRPLVAAYVAVAMAAAGVSLLVAAGQRQGATLFSTTAVSAIRFELVSDPREVDGGFRYTARAHGGNRTCKVWLTMSERMERGSVVRGVGRFSQLDDDAFGKAAWAQGICGRVRMVHLQASEAGKGPAVAIQSARMAALRAIEPERGPSRAVVAACVCGSREALDASGLADVCAACGVSHMVAVSGVHLAVIAVLLDYLLVALGLSPWARTCAILPACLGFVLVCGSPLSAVRALAMLAASRLSLVMGRRGHALSSVCVVALIMMLMDPCVAEQLAFRLSVASVAALCVWDPLVGYLLACLVPSRPPVRMPYALKRRIARLGDGVRGSMAASMTCQLATLPLVAPVFGQLSLIGPAMNLLIAGPISASMALGLVAVLCAACGIPIWPLLGLCDLLLSPVLALMRRSSCLPFACVPVPTGGWLIPCACLLVLVYAYLAWGTVEPRQVRLVVGCACAATAIVWLACRYAAPARIVVLDVGQGDAILVQDGAYAMLVDTGPDQAVVAALLRERVVHLDGVVLTHLHDDHYGGLDDLVGCIPCDRVVVAGGVCEGLPQEIADTCHTLTGTAPRELWYGDVCHVGRFALSMVWPRAPVTGTENPDSIELLVRYGGGDMRLSALLTGDAECGETGSVIEAGDVEAVDLLKVGHHGSEQSLTAEQAATLHPLLSVASAGEGNSYGHPDPSCVALLEEAGSTFLCTKDVGDVDVRPGRGAIVVHTGRPT